jgi:sialic acid synthase SpsE
MRIGEREIGGGRPVYVIAVVGVNHDGDAERALMLIDLAARAGADAVKLQYFQTDLLMSRSARLAAYQAAAGETDPVAMLRRLELSLVDMRRVVERAHERGLHAIVTVFSVDLVAEARTLAWDAFKSASPDIVHRPLLAALAADGRPMVVSTGASTMAEVVRAAAWLGSCRDRVAMLQCVSCYPAPEPALGGIAAIAAATGLPTGYSDHTASVETGGEAVAAGACILERHITDDRSRPGPDHAASLDGGQFAEYVALGRSALRADAPAPLRTKVVLPCEEDVRRVSRQSIVARRRIEAGEVIRLVDLAFKRPGTGMEPWRVGEVVGRVAARTINSDEHVREASVRAVVAA